MRFLYGFYNLFRTEILYDFLMTERNKMENQPVRKLIVTMSLPPLFSMFLQYAYNFTDSAFVASLGETSLAAVSLSFPITSLMNSMSIWIGVGTNILIARALGEKDQAKANRIAFTGLWGSVLLGVTLTLTALIFMPSYFRLYAETDLLYRACMDYMKICVFMQVPNMVHILIQKVIQGTGDMIGPMWFQIAGVVFNFIFDPLLIYGIGPFPEMGIRGAALSTVLGFSLSTVLAFLVLFNGKQKVYPTLGGEHPRAEELRGIFTLGLPSFIMNSLVSFTVSLTNVFLVRESETAVAFFGAYFKIHQLIIMTANGLIQGTLPVLNYNYGAKQYRRLNEAFRYSLFLSSVMMIIGTLILWIFPVPIIRLFKGSEDMMSFGVSALRILSLAFCFIGTNNMISTYLQSVKKVPQSVFIHLTKQLLLLVPLIWVLSRRFGLTGIWWAFPLTEILTFSMAFFLYRNAKIQA
ncbi:MAG: MATE family efflux transporter [Erysipelotrichales bacterium]|nr:MATE family efflux transporter [Erysipelotrichales bacterium]